MKNTLIPIVFMLVLSACVSTHQSLYDELGGQAKIESISNHFIEEIGNNPHIRNYFENTNIDRFHEKFVEHICMITNGPCSYTGDSMKNVHTGMNIGKADFNRAVDLLINAMDKAGIKHVTQNKLLAKLAPMRRDIIHL